MGVLAARRTVELRRLCAESASPLSRSFFFFFVETTERKLCARCSVTTPGCAGSIVCSTLVKCTQPHQRRIVKKVRGSEIAAKSQTFGETRMCPFGSVWTNCVEKKFFRELYLESFRTLFTDTYSNDRCWKIYQSDHCQDLDCCGVFCAPLLGSGETWE